MLKKESGWDSYRHPFPSTGSGSSTVMGLPQCCLAGQPAPFRPQGVWMGWGCRTTGIGQSRIHRVFHTSDLLCFPDTASPFIRTLLHFLLPTIDRRGTISAFFHHDQQHQSFSPCSLPWLTVHFLQDVLFLFSSTQFSLPLSSSGWILKGQRRERPQKLLKIYFKHRPQTIRQPGWVSENSIHL